MSGFPSWWLKVGDWVATRDDASQIGVVMEVMEPGVIKVRMGTDKVSRWYDMNDFHRVKVSR